MGRPLERCIALIRLCCGLRRSLLRCKLVCRGYSRSLAEMGLNSVSLAFVHPRLSGLATSHRLPHHSHHGSQPRASSSLHAECKPTLHRARWPWLFEQPARCTNLPAEEIFGGFDGLDGFDDDLMMDFNDLTDDPNDFDQSKVGGTWSHVVPGMPFLRTFFS